MNKTVSINLGGQIFYIDEDVFQILQNYLNSLKDLFKSDPDGTEILSDIEYRLAELFIEAQPDRNESINKETVESAIATMGTVEDFQTVDEGESVMAMVPVDSNTGSSYGSQSNAGSVHKKLLRDPDDRVLSGVCAGLGHYFGINALWVRIAFLVIFFASGIGLIPYIILWIIMPKAVSSSDKLAMKGKPVNLNTLRDNVKSEIESKSGSGVDFINQLLQYTGKAIIALGKIFLIFLGFILLMTGIGMIIALGLSFIYGSEAYSIGASLSGMGAVSFFLMRVAAFLAIAIPVILFSLLFLRLVLNRHFFTDRRYLVPMAIVWLFSILSLIFMGGSIKAGFSKEGQIVDSYEFTNEGDTLHINKMDVLALSEGNRKYINITSDSFIIKDDTIYSKNVDLNIVPADIPNYRIDVVKTAKGRTTEKAEKNAALSNYYWDHSGNELMLDATSHIPSQYKWRKPGIKTILNVPYGQIVHLDRSTRSLIDDVDNIQNIYDRDMAGRLWASTEAGLDCLNCDEARLGSSVPDGAGISAIDIEGALSVKVIQSDKEDVEFSDAVLDSYNYRYEGSKLIISPIESDINGSDISRSSAKIYVKNLNDIYIKGLAEVDLKDLEGEHIDIRIEGASSTEIDIDYTSARIEIEGAADIDMKGTLDELTLSAEGMMKIDADDLVVSDADISLMGAMRADFHVTETMDINIEGPAYVKYSGDPTVTQSIDGPARVVKR